MPAEMRCTAILSLEPDPGNAGVGMRFDTRFYRIPTPCGYAIFLYPQAFPPNFKEEIIMNRKTRTLCEAAILVALAIVLEMFKLWRLLQGGSVTLSMIPIILFAVRHGHNWGALAGLVFGGINYMMGGSYIDWTTMICDYFIAFSMLGFGAGLFKKTRFGCLFGSITGISLQFLASYLVGVFVWGKYMPKEFLGLTMTTPWFYSFLYNICWAGPDLILAVSVFGVLLQLKPLRRYLMAQDLH